VPLACSLSDWTGDLEAGLLCATKAGFPRAVIPWDRISRLPPARGSQAPDTQPLVTQGLTIVGIDLPFLARANVETLVRILGDVATWMGTASLAVAPAVSIAASDADALRLADVVQAIARLARVAKDFGLPFRIRNRRDTPAEQLDELYVLFRDARADNLSLDLDVGEFHSSAINPCDAVLSFSGRIGQVRLTDRRSRTRVPLGQGQVNVPAVLEILTEEGFDGTIAIPLEDGPDATERLAAERRYLEDHGVGV
jgi:sugar phosphate isomerase/epimerase